MFLGLELVLADLLLALMLLDEEFLDFELETAKFDNVSLLYDVLLSSAFVDHVANDQIKLLVHIVRLEFL